MQASAILAIAATATAKCAALRHIGRRSAIGLAGSAAVAAVVPDAANAAADPTVKIYFGAGCFWHVQHEFVGEEVAVLQRGPESITARTGYAGGTLGGGLKDGKVCYHNFKGVADYGSLGHAEAVQLEVPTSAVPRFAKKYFDLFGSRGYRHDPQDRGGEYRSVLGLPGGQASPLFPVIKQAALESQGGMKLYAGRGNEPDTIGDKAVLVYDSDKYPFYPAELYHQFHDDFMGPSYGKAYNSLQGRQYKQGLVGLTGCPDMDPVRDEGRYAKGFPS
eukprot:CAMPEP_0196704160 /NCGR_PEP_ID=MMETSP1090-20130531/57395_1 /TAXON_ID=37098 /ORGANISM="Isochrysis sp, Strain CCMP1244" /LENGTH=275 /DNA_ID=CAMNT_0042044039 /DNA_START=46 /DNA_END=873 /DNA_ORIENTATION=-